MFIYYKKHPRPSEVSTIAVTETEILFVEFTEQKDCSKWHDCCLCEQATFASNKFKKPAILYLKDYVMKLLAVKPATLSVKLKWYGIGLVG